MKNSIKYTFVLCIIPLFLTSAMISINKFDIGIMTIWGVPLGAWLLMFLIERDYSEQQKLEIDKQ